MRARLVVLTAALALAGCANRERSNPFDPANGNTSGRPGGFEALASDHTVQLRWQSVVGEGLIGYQIFRRTAGETEELPLTGTLPITTTQYIDRGLLNGLDHFYSIYYVFDRGLGTQPSTDVATPGARVPWVAEFGIVPGFNSGTLTRLTADARHVAERRPGLVSPSTIAVDSVSHHVWVSDPGGGQVGILDGDTGIFITVGRLFFSPGDIATESEDSTAWVCDEGIGAVIHLDSRGGQRSPVLENLDTPTGVAIDPSDGTIWVCERNADRVKRYSPAGALLDSTFVIRPSRVAIDELTHKAWVTSATQALVHRIAPGGILEDSFTGFAGPVGIEVDSRRGRIWIADVNADRVTVLARDGSVAFQVPGLPAARSIAIDHETGEAWVALPGSNEVVWLSATGSVLRRRGGLSVPYGVGILP